MGDYYDDCAPRFDEEGYEQWRANQLKRQADQRKGEKRAELATSQSTADVLGNLALFGPKEKSDG